ncbi:putative mitochondrial protein [Drosera capensis]
MIRRCAAEEEMSGILYHCHSSEYGGHFRGNKTDAKVLSSRFYWPSLFKDAHSYVASCDRCQRIGNFSSWSEMPLTSCWSSNYLMYGALTSWDPFCHHSRTSTFLWWWITCLNWVEAIATPTHDFQESNITTLSAIDPEAAVGVRRHRRSPLSPPQDPEAGSRFGSAREVSRCGRGVDYFCCEEGVGTHQAQQSAVIRDTLKSRKKENPIQDRRTANTSNLNPKAKEVIMENDMDMDTKGLTLVSNKPRGLLNSFSRIA